MNPPRIGEAIIVNGAKYRIRDITATGLFYLSRPLESLACYSLAWPRGLRYDARIQAWRAPDGLDVKRSR